MHFRGLSLLAGISLFMALTNANTVSFFPCHREEGVGFIAKSIHCDPEEIKSYDFCQLEDVGN